MAVAITRHGLYSIDRLVNRTLVYAALTALLVATYALVSLLVGLVVGGSELTASLATIAAALVFLPLRDRLQRAVDRRFARRRFEAVRLLRDFLDEVRDGRAEPEDVGAVIALALGDPHATLVFQLPETAAYADRDGHAVDAARRRPRALRDRPRPRRAAARAGGAGPAARRARRRRGAGRAGPPAGRAAAATGRGGVLARADRPGRLRGAAAAGARPARRRAAAAGHARHRAAAPAALAPARGADARPRARRRGRRGRGLDRRSADDRRRRAPAAAGRGPGGRAGRPGARRGGAGRRRRDPRPRAAGDRGHGLLRRLRGAHQRGQARVADARERRDGARGRRAADDDRRRRRRRRASRCPGMHDRVAAQGGTLAIDSPPGAGTRIAVELPCGS